MYIGQQALELPTFAPLSGCSIPEYPEDKIHQAVTVVVDGKIMSCGGNIELLPSSVPALTQLD